MIVYLKERPLLTKFKTMMVKINAYRISRNFLFKKGAINYFFHTYVSCCSKIESFVEHRE